MKKLYYIEPVTLPANNAHSLQIKTSIDNLNHYFEIEVISYYQNQKLNNCKKHHAFKRPRILNKIIPFSVLHLVSKVKKLRLNKEAFMFTRNSLIAFLFRRKFKKIILEIHDLPTIKDGFFHYILFKYWLEIIPLKLLKKSKINYVTISDGLRKDLNKKYKIKKNKIFVLPDAVDLDKFNISIKKEESRKKLKLPINKKIITYIGSFQDWKGYDILLKSSNKFDNNLLLTMIGGSDKEIKKLKKKYPEVLFLGYKPNKEIPFYLKASDILVIPNSGKFKISSHYTSPLKLFEYMASKRTIIASNLPSIKEIVSDKEVSFFDPDNYVNLSKKINSLSRDEELQKELAQNSFKAVKKYTWENRTRKIKEIFLE